MSSASGSGMASTFPKLLERLVCPQHSPGGVTRAVVSTFQADIDGIVGQLLFGEFRRGPDAAAKRVGVGLDPCHNIPLQTVAHLADLPIWNTNGGYDAPTAEEARWRRQVMTGRRKSDLMSVKCASWAAGWLKAEQEDYEEDISG
jgi:hypothetical protein